MKIMNPNHYNQYIFPKVGAEVFGCADDDALLLEEECMSALAGLADLTVKEKITWTCDAYLPIDLFPADGAADAYLQQSFTVSGAYAGRRIVLNIVEQIAIPSGKGDLTVTYCPGGDAANACTLSLLLKYDSDELSREALALAYRRDPAWRVCDAIITTLGDAPTIHARFADARPFGGRFPEQVMQHPLTALARRLRSEQDAVAFHRCIAAQNIGRA